MPVTLLKSTIIIGGSVNTPTPDATPSVKGKVQLTGPLGGDAGAPTVFGLASRAELEALILSLVGSSNPDPTDPVTYMAPGYVAADYVQ